MPSRCLSVCLFFCTCRTTHFRNIRTCTYINWKKHTHTHAHAQYKRRWQCIHHETKVNPWSLVNMHFVSKHTMYNDRILLVLNGTSWNCINAILALNRRYILLNFCFMKLRIYLYMYAECILHSWGLFHVYMDLYNTIVLDLGHFHINDNSSLPISSHDFVKSISNSGGCLQWHVLTVNTSSDYQARISFNEPVFGNREEYLEIGDGLIQGKETRLARFNGSTLPNDVISVSNAAWINIISPCTKGTLVVNLTITSETDSGILKFTLDIFYKHSYSTTTSCLELNEMIQIQKIDWST